MCWDCHWGFDKSHFLTKHSYLSRLNPFGSQKQNFRNLIFYKSMINWIRKTLNNLFWELSLLAEFHFPRYIVITGAWHSCASACFPSCNTNSLTNISIFVTKVKNGTPCSQTARLTNKYVKQIPTFLVRHGMVYLYNNGKDAERWI